MGAEPNGESRASGGPGASDAPGSGAPDSGAAAQPGESAEPAAEPAADVIEEAIEQGAASQSILRNRNFVRLLGSQFVSSLGDWIGMFAVIAIATKIARRDKELATSLVMVARVLPGFIFAPVAGVLVDRWDRRKTMIVCDLARGVILVLLPFVTQIWTLFLVSFALEVFAMLWQPAKEALVPGLVEPEDLVHANSLGLGASYATFPVGGFIFTALAGVAAFLGNLGIPYFDASSVNQVSLAIWVDCLTFFASALLIWRLHLPRGAAPGDGAERQKLDLGRTWRELREGWAFIGSEPVVRVIIVGMGVALLGGASVVPLGATYAQDVLHGGETAFGLVLTGVGTGVAIGVVTLIVWSRARQHHSMLHFFTLALITCGAGLFAAASVDQMALGLVFVVCFGMGGGAAYICGFTALGQAVDDELRGRVFASLLTIVRFCVLLAVAVAPLVAGAATSLLRAIVPSGHVQLLSWFSIDLNGTRVVFWAGGVIVTLTGIWARRSYHRLERSGVQLLREDA